MFMNACTCWFVGEEEEWLEEEAPFLPLAFFPFLPLPPFFLAILLLF
jgi:hypothetical protein